MSELAKLLSDAQHRRMALVRDFLNDQRAEDADNHTSRWPASTAGVPSAPLLSEVQSGDPRQ
jgi:hypothetical protein